MSVDFRTTDDDMAELEDKMAAITKQSARVSDNLRERRQKTAQLAAQHGLLKKMEFLFELPERLKECIADKDYTLGVKYYVRAQKVLDQYENMPSFSGIQTDCDQIMIQLRSALRDQLKQSGTSETRLSTQEMTNCVYLLLLLNTPASELCDEYLESSRSKLEDHLGVLERQVLLAKRASPSVDITPDENEGQSSEIEGRFDDSMDILEFVTHGCENFLSDACLIIASYNETFITGNIDQCNLMSGLSAFFLLDQDNNSNLLLFPVKRLLNNNALFVDALVALTNITGSALRFPKLGRLQKKLAQNRSFVHRFRQI